MSLALVWQPIFPTLSILGGAVLLCALAIFAFVRSRSVSSRWSILLLIMRLAAVVVIATLLMGPSRELSTGNAPGDSRLTILLDTSESMRVDDCESTSRIAHAAKTVLAPKALAALEGDYHVDLQGFDEGVHALSIQATRQDPDAQAKGRSTRLAESVTAVLNRLGGEGDALLVVSDGRDTTDDSLQPAASLAATKRIPIYTVPVGGAATSADAAVMAIPMQDSLIPNETGGLLIRVYQAGLNGQSGVVHVRQGAKEQQIPVAFGSQPVVEVQASIREEAPGQYDYTISLDPVGDETELSNNQQRAFVEVMKRRLRVLLLEGQPFWDSKFLAQSLRKDEQVELVQLTQVGARKRETLVTRESQGSPRLPETDEEWGELDVVVLGQGIEQLLDEDAARQLVRFVQNGGHVVFSRGRPYDVQTPQGQALSRILSVIEPVTWHAGDDQKVSIELTPSGETSSWFTQSKLQIDPAEAFHRLPGFERLHHVAFVKPATIVLATGRTGEGAAGELGRPAIVRMTAGRGDVVAILGEGTWKWSLLTPELQDLRGFYDQFWSNLVRWLALGGDFPPGQQSSLQLSRSSVRLGDELTMDVVYRFSPDGAADPRLTLTDPRGQAVDVAMHRLPGPSPRYRAKFTPESSGVYTVAAETPGMTPPRLEGRFNVYDVNMERLQTASNPLALKMLSDLSGGSVIEGASMDELANQLQKHRRAMLAPPRVEYVWDRASIMFLLLGWIGAEWLLRRAAGLW